MQKEERKHKKTPSWCDVFELEKEGIFRHNFFGKCNFYLTGSDRLAAFELVRFPDPLYKYFKYSKYSKSKRGLTTFEQEKKRSTLDSHCLCITSLFNFEFARVAIQIIIKVLMVSMLYLILNP